MPPLSSKFASNPIKMLLVGNSGSGKTGAIASLAQDYELAFLDFDSGTDILATTVPPNLHSKVWVETVTDKYGDAFLCSLATAWPKAINLLVNWKTPEYDLGPVGKWDRSRILVVDSLTFSGRAAMNHILSLNNRLGKQPYQSDWGAAIDLQESLLAKLFSPDIKCHVIVTAHLTSVRQDSGELDEKTGQPIMTTVQDQLFPSALGNKLPPKVARYFNTMLRTKIVGSGRFILTQPQDGVDSKCIIPNMPAMLPVKDGMLQYFRKVREAFGQ